MVRVAAGAHASCPVLAALIKRVEVRVDQVDIHLRPTGLSALFDTAVTPSQSVLEEETVILSMPARLRRAGMEIRMLIDRTDPFAVVKPDPRLIKLLVRARRFNASLIQSDAVRFAALAMREGVSLIGFGNPVDVGGDLEGNPWLQAKARAFTRDHQPLLSAPCRRQTS